MITLKSWTHPKTNETRLYVGGIGAGSAKIWIERAEQDQFGCDFDIKIRSDFHTGGEKANLVDYAEKEIYAALGGVTLKFDEIATLAK